MLTRWGLAAAEKGISEEEIARRCGWTARHTRAIMNGVKDMEVEEVFQLADALELKTTEQINLVFF